MRRYIEVPTETTRYQSGVDEWQRYYEKVTPERTVIIDGKRCKMQKIVGGVWRSEEATNRGLDKRSTG